MTLEEQATFLKAIATLSVAGRAAIQARMADVWDEGREQGYLDANDAPPYTHVLNPYRKA